jgi:GH15 family glucan-1,4-alpha-glucosidase
MANRIEDYALIGDLETAPLVGIDGSIDWCCVPRFDSPACFASLLGDEENGFWRIAPIGEARASRAYRKDSLVLETRFEVEGGAVTVIDFMPLKKGDTSIIRIVRGESGRVDMRMELVIRFDYGRTVPWVRRADFGLTATSGPNAIELRTPALLEGKDFRTYSTFSVAAGESVPFTFCYHPSLAPPVHHDDPEGACAETAAWWQKWAQGCTYGGEYWDAVVRSLITLKALTHRPSGGIVAAATTSLPEVIGGKRNWDYRYCWLRDATFTLYALMTSGMTEEALAWREWLLRVAAGKPSQMQTIYGPTGEHLLPEFEIDWLAGYEGSRPVRIGNQAHRQLQLDIYGEVMDVFHVSRRSGLKDDDDSWAFQEALIDFIETGWRQPDNGIWEVRGPRRHFTHSKVMAWVALDRAIKAVEVYGHQGPVKRWKQLRQAIHDEVCMEGFNPDLNSFTQFYGSNRLDASLLMLPWVGFLPANDPRCLGTVAAIERHLMQDGFVSRYETSADVEGVHGSEGAFLSCTFWLADNYALMGRTAEAEEIFVKLLAIRNDVGLLAEEYDPIAKRHLGNFPQALSHISLINTAHNLTSTSPAVHRASP